MRVADFPDGLVLTWDQWVGLQVGLRVDVDVRSKPAEVVVDEEADEEDDAHAHDRNRHEDHQVERSDTLIWHN